VFCAVEEKRNLLILLPTPVKREKGMGARNLLTELVSKMAPFETEDVRG
jgi:hypothetical protein